LYNFTDEKMKPNPMWPTYCSRSNTKYILRSL